MQKFLLDLTLVFEDIQYVSKKLSLPNTSFLYVFLKGFSVYQNLRKILNTGGGSSDPSNLVCLNGFRYLSISWVVLGHVLWEYTNVSNFGVLTSSATATGLIFELIEWIMDC